METLSTQLSSSNTAASYSSKMRMALGRKRNRLGLACFASTLALSVSAVTAFHAVLPSNPRTVARSGSSGTSSAGSWSLNVVTDPDLLVVETVDNLYDISRPKNGSEQAKRRRNPPRVTVQSRSAASVAKAEAGSSSSEETATSDTTKARSAAKTTKVSTRGTRDRQQTKRSSYRSSTMPGYGSSASARTGREKAFRDGIKLVEQRTGKKLGKYIDTPEARKKRRQVNGEAMYKTSASVPDSLVQFANEIHNVDRITPKEEIELGEKTQEAIRLQTLHDDLTERLDRPPTDEEWCAEAGKINLEAIKQAIDDGLEAKNKLVTSNLRMVQGVVNLYIRNGLGGQYNAGDLMQEGIMALVRAAEKFDPSRGFRFSTYAMYWIRSAVKRSQVVQSRVITVPQRLYENHKRILRVEKELAGELGRKPTRKELSEAVGMSEVQVERCVTAMKQRCFSLDQGIQNTKKPMGADRSTDTMIDLIDSKTDDGEWNKQRRILMREDLVQTLYRHLTPEEVELLLLRYGLHDELPPEYGFGPLTIASVSNIVGLKPDKVRRMINKSLKQLQVIMGDEWMDYERELNQ